MILLLSQVPLTHQTNHTHKPQQLELVGEGQAGSPPAATAADTKEAAAVAAAAAAAKAAAAPTWMRPLGKRGGGLLGVRSSLFAVSSVMRVAPHDKEAVLRRQLQVRLVPGCDGLFG